jgi:hypothetical protein
MSYCREEAVEKLKNKSREDQLKMIWQWIKIGHINFKEFSELLNFVKEESKEEYYYGGCWYNE